MIRLKYFQGAHHIILSWPFSALFLSSLEVFDPDFDVLEGFLAGLAGGGGDFPFSFFGLFLFFVPPTTQIIPQKKNTSEAEKHDDDFICTRLERKYIDFSTALFNHLLLKLAVPMNRRLSFQHSCMCTTKKRTNLINNVIHNLQTIVYSYKILFENGATI